VTGLSPGTTYSFRLVAQSDAGNDVDRTLTFTTPSAPAALPTAVTSPATGIGQHGATLHGTVNPHGSATTYYLQYGRTTSYGQRTAVRDAGSGTTPVSVAATLSGLPRQTTYHFRLVAVNANGTSRGVDRSFRTG
jgi:hypothetical protein